MTICNISGFAVTTPLSTLIDVARSNLSPEHLETALRDAFGYGRVRRGSLEAQILNLTGRTKKRLVAALEAQA